MSEDCLLLDKHTHTTRILLGGYNYTLTVPSLINGFATFAILFLELSTVLRYILPA